MNVLEFVLNFFNPTQFTNITFYSLLIIIISNSIAALLHFYSPRNRKILIALSVPKTITITYIIINALCQLGEIVDTLFLFQAFLLVNGLLILCKLQGLKSNTSL